MHCDVCGPCVYICVCVRSGTDPSISLICVVSLASYFHNNLSFDFSKDTTVNCLCSGFRPCDRRRIMCPGDQS